MSTDARVTKNLIQTLEDGRKGFESAADKLTESDRPELATQFRQFAEQRAGFAAELRSLALAYGDDADDSGSLAGTVHRGWMAVKDAVTGSNPNGVLDTAEQGEDHAVSAYAEALTADLSGDLRSIVERQYLEVQQAHRTVRTLRDQAA